MRPEERMCQRRLLALSLSILVCRPKTDHPALLFSRRSDEEAFIKQFLAEAEGGKGERMV